jgi:putative DNA primase/helicase
VIKETTGVISPITENIPKQLTERPQWVCWCREMRDGEVTKILYTPGTERRAKSNDLKTWRTFEEAVEAYEASEPMAYAGVGFVFCSVDPFVGIDLDDCRNAESGEISPWAQKIIGRVQEGYIEISPSGEGVHIIVEGSVRNGRTRKEVHEKGKRVGRVEMYGHGKFFTVTGAVL